jgi:hypothetical protein
MSSIVAQLTIPSALHAKATYALRELCHRVGFGLRVVNDGHAHIHYTTGSEDENAHCVTIHCNPLLYLPGTRCKEHVRNRPVWEAEEAGNSLDIVGGAFRLLTLADESRIPREARDSRGLFEVSALPIERRRTIGIPFVDLHAEELQEQLLRRWPELEQARKPLWPGGKRFALQLTHDTDHIHIGAPCEIAANAAKALFRRSREHMELVKLGLKYFNKPLQNPYFRFKWWRQFELELGIRSTFYLFVRPASVKPHVNDSKSSVAGSAVDWPLFRSMVDDGWEYGLHASIHAHHSPNALKVSRQWLEERLARRVVGVRHHYFAFDWLHPYESHRKQAEAGFEYDSSVTYRDSAGFRTGTCFPHQAFDLERDKPIPLLLMPSNLMDGHLLFKDVNGTREDFESAVAKGKAIADTISSHGGMLVFNWHQESAFNSLIYRDFIDVLTSILPTCLRGDPWNATAAEMCAHWKYRAQSLDTGCTLATPLLSTFTI